MSRRSLSIIISTKPRTSSTARVGSYAWRSWQSARRVPPTKIFPLPFGLTAKRKRLRAGAWRRSPPETALRVPPYVFHRFFAKTGMGDLVIGEVSKINGDNTDNVFAKPQDRFCGIDEDAVPYRLLVNEYH